MSGSERFLGFFCSSWSCSAYLSSFISSLCKLPYFFIEAILKATEQLGVSAALLEYEVDKIRYEELLRNNSLFCSPMLLCGSSPKLAVIFQSFDLYLGICTLLFSSN